MPKITRLTENVQGRISQTVKLKMMKYKNRYNVTEGEIGRCTDKGSIFFFLL